MLATSLIALVVAACGSKPASVTPEDPKPQAAVPPAPLVDAGAPREAAVGAVTPPSDDPLVDGIVTAEVDGARFGFEGKVTEYRRGELRIWIAPAVPADQARTIARRVRGRDVFAMTLEPDHTSGVIRVQAFVNRIADRIADGGVPPATSKLTARQALDERTRELTKRSDEMVRLLREGKEETRWAQAHRPAAVEQELGKIRKLPKLAPISEAAQQAQDAEMLAAYNKELEAFEFKPITTMGLVILDVPDTVALRLVLEEHDDLRPTDEQAAAVLASWAERYGARLVGDKLDVQVSKPPRTLAEARRAALELYLMCPGHPDGYATHRLAADELIEQVTSTYWECNWFVE